MERIYLVIAIVAEFIYLAAAYNSQRDVYKWNFNLVLMAVFFCVKYSRIEF